MLHTPERATALLPEICRRLTEVRHLTKRLAEMEVALRRGRRLPAPMAEAKAQVALVHDALGWFGSHQIHVRGVGPDLLDFLASRDGHLVFLCWREGEPEVAHWHEVDEGYLERRLILPEFRWLDT